MKAPWNWVIKVKQRRAELKYKDYFTINYAHNTFRVKYSFKELLNIDIDKLNYKKYVIQIIIKTYIDVYILTYEWWNLSI